MGEDCKERVIELQAGIKHRCGSEDLALLHGGDPGLSELRKMADYWIRQTALLRLTIVMADEITMHESGFKKLELAIRELYPDE